jgi:hypothetical protein
MSSVRLLAVLAVAAVVALAVPAVALAIPGPIELISKNTAEQADFASESVISADGRFVAFYGSIAGLKGIFRKTLASGEVQPVAVESVYREPIYTGPAAAVEARSPSISADGRYVSFSTFSSLTPGDEAGSPAEDRDVYVADMASGVPQYELASALGGSEAGISYAEGGGAFVAAKVALSADGREVAFTVGGASDLLGEPEGTPGGQVVVRDLATRQTTLVSVERDPTTGLMSDRPVEGGAVAEAFGGGASLSADGSTVAWLGLNLQLQVPMLRDEMKPEVEVSKYNEPLWRRIADGATAPTRRIIGGGDPLAPGCPADGSIAEPACQGPFPNFPLRSAGGSCEPSGWDDLAGAHYETLPQMSADGRTVALLGAPELVTNLFLVNMEPGLSRKQAVTELTHSFPLAENACLLAGQPQFEPRDGFVTDLAISPSASRVAFTTVRQQFPESTLNLLTAPPSGVGGTELFLADIKAGTLERLTPRKTGEPSRAAEGTEEPGANSPSFGEGGQKLSFSSTASNLVLGDANERSDAFVISVPEVVGSPGQTQISSPPPPPVPRASWKFTATAASLPDGRVRIRALIPAAGKVSGRAQALVGTHLHRRKVSAATRRGAEGGVLRFNLRLASRFRSLARTKTGLEAVVKLGFHTAGKKNLTAVLPVRFRVHRKHGRKQKK